MSKSEEIAEQFNTHVMSTYAPKLALVRGQGTKVWDADGKVYLDFVSGISVLNVGHCHPRVTNAIQKQCAQLMHVSNLYYTEPAGRLAQRLSAIGPGGKCFFANSGAEANEGMIKLARLWGHDSGRYEIVCMTQSFHGRTLATAAATGQEKVKKGFEPLPEGFVHATFNDLDSVRAAVGEKTVAILVEAVQGEGGVIPADEVFMTGLRELCDAKDMLLLCDEVQCGMGRTGRWFAYQGYGVVPDAISVAKSLGGGFPIGAVIASPKVSDVFHPGHHASTFGGTPLACMAALAVIDTIEAEGLVERAASKGAQLQRRLDAFVAKYERVVQVRGRGMMIGIVLSEPAQPLVDLLADFGLLTLATAGNVVRLLPPLNARDSEIEEALEIMDDALAEWHGLSEDVEAAEEDEPSAAAAEGSEEATEEAAG